MPWRSAPELGWTGTAKPQPCPFPLLRFPGCFILKTLSHAYMVEPGFKFYSPGPTTTSSLATAFRKTEPVKVSGLYAGNSEAKEPRQGSGSADSSGETVEVPGAGPLCSVQDSLPPRALAQFLFPSISLYFLTSGQPTIFKIIFP